MSAIIFTLFGTTSAVEFDCTLTETHSSSAKATEHPVEEGANVSDHVRPELDRVQIEGVITNTPLNDVSVSTFLGEDGRPLKRIAALQGRPATLALHGKTSIQTKTGSLRGGFVIPVLVPVVGGAIRQATASQPEFVPGERRTVYNSVSGTSMQFSTPMDRVKEVYGVLQMLCTSGVEVKLVTDLREYPTMLIESLSSPRAPMDAMVFSMTLKQIRFAETKKSQVRLTKRVAQPRAETKTKEGDQGTEYVLEQDEDALESLAVQTSGSSRIIETE